MACEGCADRRRKLQRWFRRLINAAQGSSTEVRLTRLDGYTRVNREIHKNDITEMRRQHNVLDRSASEWFMKLEAASQSHSERMLALRAINAEFNTSIRALESRLDAFDDALTELTETVKKFEFPEIRVPEFKIDEKD